MYKSKCKVINDEIHYLLLLESSSEKSRKLVYKLVSNLNKLIKYSVRMNYKTIYINIDYGNNDAIYIYEALKCIELKYGIKSNQKDVIDFLVRGNKIKITVF